MDVSFVIKRRLHELDLEQRDLASAAQVTESYISQLLNGRKAPPAPERTDIYDKMERLLKLTNGELSKLAGVELKEELKRKLADPPAPLLKEVRQLVLRKCKPDKERRMRAIFEKQPFGDVERMVTQKLLDVAKRVAKEELENEKWLRRIARLSGRSYAQMRVIILEFLDTDVFKLSLENCVSFLDPLIESWEIDLATFGMEITLNQRVATDRSRRFEFVEKEPDPPFKYEPGLKRFLKDVALCGNVTEEEIDFLRKLRFKDKRPKPLYYYRELQNLRDPLHFRAPQTRSETEDST